MSRTAPSDDEILEWLADMRRSAGPDADRATALLDWIEERSALEEELAAHKYTPDEAQKLIDEREALVELIEAQEGAGFDGETPEEKLRNGLRDMEESADRFWELRSLAIDAGLIAPGDRTTDVAPLFRLFLPV